MGRALGSGSYGIVYRASWRSLNVAVKALKLPERHLKATTAAQAKLKQKVEDVLFDFVTPPARHMSPLSLPLSVSDSELEICIPRSR